MSVLQKGATTLLTACRCRSEANLHETGTAYIVDQTFDFREPWEAADSPESILEQLEQALSPGHPLCGNVVEVLATRIDSDDILLRTKTGYAMAHLGWCRRSQASLPFPHSVYFKDWESFYHAIYLPDIEEWEEENPSDDWSEILS